MYSLEWVHTQKEGKRKSRWVARGFEQRNVDLSKFFAAVVNKDTLRAVLAILNVLDYYSSLPEWQARSFRPNLCAPTRGLQW